MKEKDSSYVKESYMCYLFCSLFMVGFIGVIFVCGQFTGADWLALF